MSDEPREVEHVFGHVDIHVKGWYAEIDESWPVQDHRSIDLKPLGDDLFIPHFSIGLIGSRQELKRIANQILAQCRKTEW